MIHRVLRIGRWVLDVLFSTEEYDVEGVLSCMYEIDAPYSAMMDSKHLMESGDMNTGFMYANPENKRAILCVGPTTSGSEFLDTVVHEVHHFAVVVASELGIDLESETPAYVLGDTIREIADIVCRMGCDNCHPRYKID